MKNLLFPFSFLFWIITGVRNWLYDKSLLKSHKVSQPVLCVGNITTGGTGKTPWVQYLTQSLEKETSSLSIVSRGYGGEYEGFLKVQDDMDPKLCGDEPLWLRRNTKASVYLCKDRVRGASEAIAHEKSDLIILDDGYQHRRLHRDVNLVILDASASSSSYRLLPVGQMREGFKALNRAHMVVINKCNYSDDYTVQKLVHQCEPYVDASQIFKADFVFDQWQALFDNHHQSFKNQNLSICCGLGNPQAFVKTVKSQNLEVKEEFIFPDHFYWKPLDIEKMTYQMKNSQSFDLMVTEKDAVKLVRYKKHFLEMGIQLWVCKMRVKLHSDENEFFTQLNNLWKKS